MASVCTISLFGLLITTLLFQSGCALRMEVNPQPFSQLVHSTLDISCIDDGSTARHVVVMQIQRPNQKPIAVINGNEGLTMGPSSKSNIQADGHLDAHAGRSSLRIAITKPSMGDAGVYECALFYLDSSYQLEEIRTDFNVSIDNEDIMSSIVTHFKGIFQGQTSQIEALQDLVSKQINKIEELNVTTREQEQQLTLMKARASYQCAFTARYRDDNKLIKGQTLLFADILVNIGNAYDVTSGVFTAPRDGVYVFHLMIKTKQGGDHVSVYLYKNGSLWAIVNAVDKDNFDTSSSSILIPLLTGDTVKPKVWRVTGDNVLWHCESIFSGYLLSLS